MALIDKLNRIKQTKEGIKATLISKGVPVADSDTFYSYIEKIRLLGDYSGGEIVYGNIVVSTNTLTVAEKATTTFTVNLDSEPSLSQVVSLSLDNSNASIDKSSLTFTKDNYNQPQTVTVTGTHVTDSHDDLQSLLTLKTSTGTDATINITITNIDVEQIPTTEISITTNDIDINNLKANKTYQFGYTREPSNATDEIKWTLSQIGSVNSEGLVTTNSNYGNLEKIGYLTVFSGSKNTSQQLKLVPTLDTTPSITSSDVVTSEYLSYDSDTDVLTFDAALYNNTGYWIIYLTDGTSKIKTNSKYVINMEVIESTLNIDTIRVVFGAIGIVSYYSGDTSMDIANGETGIARGIINTKSVFNEGYCFRTAMKNITSGILKFKLEFIEILE